MTKNNRNLEETTAEDAFYAELTKINNELVNTQRELNRKTVALEKLNQQLQSEIEERQRVETRLRDLSQRDPLTGAFNRRYFIQVCQDEISRTNRYRHPIAIIMLDIDHFKKVNDTYGHPIGDEVLVQFSKTCQSHLRTTDVFARYGGEEFIILLPETDKNQAKSVAERLREVIAELSITGREKSFQITSSFGVSDIGIDDFNKSLEEVLNEADQALYQAKLNGRNQVNIWG